MSDSATHLMMYIHACFQKIFGIGLRRLYCAVRNDKPRLWGAFGRHSSGEFLTLIGYGLSVEDRISMKYVSKLHEQQHEI